MPIEPTRKPPRDTPSSSLVRDAIQAYVVQLNLVITSARETHLATALAALDAVPPPPGNPHGVGYLQTRKRRELLARFGRYESEIMRPPGQSLDRWLAYFFSSADLAGCQTIWLVWRQPPPGCPTIEELAIKDARAVRARLRQAEVGLPDVSAIGHSALDDRGHAILDIASGWLTVAGPPYFVEHSKRELDRVSGQTPLALRFSYDLGRPLLEGMALPVRVGIRNNSQDIIVIETVGGDQPQDQRETFGRALHGSLIFDPERRAFAHDPRSLDTAREASTPECFHTAVLRPGQERSVVLVLRLLEGGDAWRQIDLCYRRFTREAFADVAYVAQPGQSWRYPARTEYIRLGADADPNATDLASVLLTGLAADALHTMSWAYPFLVGHQRFSLAQARSLVPEGSVPVHFSTWKQAWVLRVDGHCALVSPDQVIMHPLVAPECFILIDEVDHRVPIRFADDLVATFRTLPLGIGDWGGHRLGLSIAMPKFSFPLLIQEIERLGCRVEVTQNLVGRASLYVCW